MAWYRAGPSPIVKPLPIISCLQWPICLPKTHVSQAKLGNVLVEDGGNACFYLLPLALQPHVIPYGLT